MEWWHPNYVWPIVGALVAGGLIGFEREFRGRPAGFRTHILVCLASALLMLAAVHQIHWLTDTPNEVVRIDPVRMAHGVLTGVGFLCGGVIFREGFSIHGLTTAASLWITSALGTLFGIGFYGLAIAGTAVTLVVLALFRLLDNVLPQLRHVDIAIRFDRVRAPPESEILATLAEFELRPAVVTHRLVPEGVEIAATFRRIGHVPTEALSRRLCADDRVVGFEISPRNE